MSTRDTAFGVLDPLQNHLPRLHGNVSRLPTEGGKRELCLPIRLCIARHWTLHRLLCLSHCSDSYRRKRSGSPVGVALIVDQCRFTPQNTVVPGSFARRALKLRWPRKRNFFIDLTADDASRHSQSGYKRPRALEKNFRLSNTMVNISLV